MSRVEDNEVNAAKCICPNCPTWLANECPKAQHELLYCASGRSVCDLPEKGCICGLCPLWEEYDLSKGYFCLYGAAE